MLQTAIDNDAGKIADSYTISLGTITHKEVYNRKLSSLECRFQSAKLGFLRLHSALTFHNRRCTKSTCHLKVKNDATTFLQVGSNRILPVHQCCNESFS